jgi:hypothetical protein
MCTCAIRPRLQIRNSYDSSVGSRDTICKWQIDHELSLAYSKEQNAIVGRANKEVMRHLTAIIFDRQTSEVVWSSKYLPLVQRIINAKVHDTIGVSPAELVFGKSINLYTGLLLSIPPESLIKGTAEVRAHRRSDHVDKLIKVKSLLIETASS